MPREITRPESQGNARPWSFPNDQAALQDREGELWDEVELYCRRCDSTPCECDDHE